MHYLTITRLKKGFRSISFLMLLTFLANNLFAQFGTKVYKNAPAGQNTSIIWTGENTIVTGASTGDIYSLDLANGNYTKVKKPFSAAITDLETIIGGDILVASGNQLKTLNSEKSLGGHAGKVTDVEQNKFSNFFATADATGKVLVWDRKYQLINTFNAHQQNITNVAISPNGLLIATASGDQSVKIMNANTGEEIKSFVSSKNLITNLLFNNDGSLLLAATNSGGIVGWNTADWERAFVTRALNTPISSISVSRDDSYLICSSETSTMSLIYLSRESKDKISFGEAYKIIKFNPSGTKIAGLALNGEIHVYDCSGLKVGEQLTPGGDNAPLLKLSDLTINEQKPDGLISLDDSPVVSFNLSNEGGQAFGLVGTININPAIKGVSYEKEISLNGLSNGITEKIEIPLVLDNTLETSSKSFIEVSFKDGSGKQTGVQKIKISTLSMADIEKQKAAEVAAKKAADEAKSAAEKEAKINEDYTKLITQADELFNQKKWNESIAVYENAQKLKPKETYPAGKIEKAKKADADEKLAKAEEERLAKLGNQYEDLLKQGDLLSSQKKWDEAISKYNEASVIMPKEKTPKTKIVEVETAKKAEADLMVQKAEEERLAKLEGEYQANMKKGDEFLAQKKWDESLKSYEDAKVLKPKDIEVKNKLTALTAAKTEAEKQEKTEAEYTQAIQAGDNLLTQKKWDEATASYKLAEKLKPGTTATKIAGVEKAKADELAKVAEAERLAKLEQEYQAHISKADVLFNQKSWDEAIVKYKDAIKVKGNDTYATGKINSAEQSKSTELALLEKQKAEEAAKQKAAEEAARIQRERVLEEQKKIEAEKQRLIAEKAAADLAAKEKARLEQEAAAAKKLEEIRLREEEKKKLAEEKAKADELARLEKIKAEEAAKLQREKDAAELAAKEKAKADELARQEKLKAEEAAKQKATEEAAKLQRERVLEEQKKIEAEKQKSIAEKQAADLAAKAKLDQEAAAAKKLADDKNKADELARLEKAKADEAAKQKATEEAAKLQRERVLEEQKKIEAQKAAEAEKMALKNVEEAGAKPKSSSKEDELAELKRKAEERKAEAEKARFEAEAAAKAKVDGEEVQVNTDNQKNEKLLEEQKAREQAAQKAADDAKRKEQEALAAQKLEESRKREAELAAQKSRVLEEQKKLEQEKALAAQKATDDAKRKEQEALAAQKLEESRKREAELAAQKSRVLEEQKKLEQEKALAASSTTTTAQPSSTTTIATDSKVEQAKLLVAKEKNESIARAELDSKQRFEQHKIQLQEEIVKIQLASNKEAGIGINASVDSEPLDLTKLDVNRPSFDGLVEKVEKMSPITLTLTFENKGIKDLDLLVIEYDLPDRVMEVSGIVSSFNSVKEGDKRTDKFTFYSLNDYNGDIVINVNIYANGDIDPSMTKKYIVKFGDKLSLID